MARPSTRARCSLAQNRVMLMGIHWAKPRILFSPTDLLHTQTRTRYAMPTGRPRMPPQQSTAANSQPHGGRAVAGKASALVEGPQRHMGAAG